MTSEQVSITEELERLRVENETLRARVADAQRSLDELRAEALARRAEVRELVEALPAAMSRRSIVAGLWRDVLHHPDKRGVVQTRVHRGRSVAAQARLFARAPRLMPTATTATPTWTPSSTGDVRVFVAARGNEFMRDIAAWLVEASAATGRRAGLVDRRPPARRRCDQPRRRATRVLRAPSGARARTCNARLRPASASAPNSPVHRGSSSRLDACRRGLARARHQPTRCRRAARARHRRAPAPTRCRRVDARSGRHRGHRRPNGRRPVHGRTRRPPRCGPRRPRRPPVHAPQRSPAVPLRATRHARRRRGLVFGREKYELLAAAKVLVNVHRDRGGHDAPPLLRVGADDRGHGQPLRRAHRALRRTPNRSWPDEHFVEAEQTISATSSTRLLDDGERRDDDR